MSYHLFQEQPVVFGLADEKERQPGLTEDQMRKLSINEDIVDGMCQRLSFYNLEGSSSDCYTQVNEG